MFLSASVLLVFLYFSLIVGNWWHVDYFISHCWVDVINLCIRPTGVRCKCVCLIIKAPPAVIVLHCMGMGTSLPELLLQPDAAIHNLPEIAIGTATGSSLTNLLLIADWWFIYPMKTNLRTKKNFLMIAVILLAGLVVFVIIEIEKAVYFFIGFSLFLNDKMLHKTCCKCAMCCRFRDTSTFWIHANQST